MANDTQFRWLFKQPIKSDWAFLLWIGISSLAVLATFMSNLSNGGISAGSTFGAISGLIDAAFTILGNLFVWYLISLLWLLPRRLLSK
jgi:hypothetical protein